MLEWYQHIPQNINPIVFSIGFFSLYWYAVCYLMAIFVCGILLWRNMRSSMSFDDFLDFVFYILTGVLIGGRMGYVLLYNFSFYFSNPLLVIWPFNVRTHEWVGIAGMSYYGGLFGVVVALCLYARKQKVSFWQFGDALATIVPLGYMFGRIGNFLNGELYGRVTDVSWGMYFNYADFGELKLRHPSQLYEAFFEGFVIFAILQWVRKKQFPDGFISLVYVMSYSFIRFFVEYVREPDPQIGLLFGNTMGQIVSMIVFIWSATLFFCCKEKI